MSKPAQYSSPILVAIHETAEDMQAAGLMDSRTMHEFDAACAGKSPAKQPPASRHDKSETT